MVRGCLLQDEFAAASSCPVNLNLFQAFRLAVGKSESLSIPQDDDNEGAFLTIRGGFALTPKLNRNMCEGCI